MEKFLFPFIFGNLSMDSLPKATVLILGVSTQTVKILPTVVLDM